MSSNNAIIVLKGKTTGPIVKGEILDYVKRPYEFDNLRDGDIVVQAMYLSVDPYLRNRIRDKSLKSYNQPFEEGKPIYNWGVGRIYNSKNSEFKVGDVVEGHLDWAEYTHLDATQSKRLRVLENKYKIPWSAFTSILGMPGFTAYCGLRHIGHPKKGETIFISAASGAVGQVVGQLAKKDGLRVVGSAGSDEKVKFLLEELDFDAAFNYKKEKPADALPRLCPDGIDVYWENVGGETLDAVLLNANNFSRFVGCGMISSYAKSETYGVKNLMQIISKRIRFEGFIQGDLRHLYWDDFCKEIEKAVGEGKLKYKEDITVGLENGIEAFAGMLEGKNFGKAIIKVSD